MRTLLRVPHRLLLAHALASVLLLTLSGQKVGAAETATKSTPAPARALLTPEWQLLASGALDVAVSHDGQRWYVGIDGRAYRWLEGKRAWVVHGSRTDLARIDAASEGAAALSKSGELYVTGSDPNDAWRPTGMRASDVGMGGGMLWLADARLPGGGMAVLGSRFDPSAKNFSWREVPGRLERLDVDPTGRPWGLDKAGRLFVYSAEKWIEDTRAPDGADVGLGGKGALFLVGRAMDNAQGGGLLFQRNPATGAWTPLPGRLSAVSVDPAGRALGVNALSWLLSSTALAASDPNLGKPPAAEEKKKPESEKPKDEKQAPAELMLSDLAGAGSALPDALASAPVRRLQGDAAKGLFIGETTISGLKTKVARYTPRSGTAANLLLWHEKLSIGDYLPDLRGTQFRDLKLGNAVFCFVPEANAGLKPGDVDGRELARILKRSELAALEPVAGTTLLGTLDLKDHAASPLADMLGLGSSTIALSATKVDAALFTDVTPGESPAISSAPARTLEELKAKYGSGLINSLVFTAPAKALDRKRFGPATITAPVWRFALAQGEEGGAGIGFEIAFDADLNLAVRVPVLPTAPPAVLTTPSANTRAPVPAKPAAPAFTPETLSLKGTHVVFTPRERRLGFTGTLTREKATSLVSYAGFELEPAKLAGSLTLAEKLSEKNGIARLAALEMTATTKGKMPSRSSGSEKPSADVSIELMLDEESQTLTPTLIADGGLTLRDIVGNHAVVPDVALRRFEISPTHMAGTVELYGLPVKAVRYKTAEMPEAIVALYHQKLDLGSYIPKVREFSLGSFGLTNTVLFVLPDTSKQSLSFDKDKLPEPLLALLDRERIKDEDLYPITIKPGINLIGMYEKNENGAKANLVPGQVTEGAGKVMSVYGIDGDAYVVKANFKASALSKAGFSMGSGGSLGGLGGGGTSGGSLACGVVAVADKADRSGLDLSFRLPGFKPPYVGSTISFAQSRFSLKDIDGQLEPEIVTGLTLKLPTTLKSKLPGTSTTVTATNQSGIREIGMAGKLRVRGELSQLCTKLTRDSNLQVEIAASSALNLAQVGDTAFAALQRVTENTPVPEPSSKGGASSKSTAKPAKLGWEKPFGISFLTVNQLALAGTFVQEDKARTLDARLWTESRLNSQTLDVFGRLNFAMGSDESSYALADWQLIVPGPVELANLPGIDKLNSAAPYVTLGDLKASSITLGPRESAGKLSASRLGSTKHDFRGDFLLQSPEAGDVSLFATLDRFAPNLLLKKEVQLRSDINDLTQGNYLFVVRSGASTQTRLGDLPDAVRGMFATTVGTLLSDDTSVPLVKGFSAATVLNPKVPDKPAYASLKRLLTALELTDPMPVFAGVEVGRKVGADGTATANASVAPRGFVEAWVPKFSLPAATQLGLSFSNSRIGLNNTDGKTVRLTTDVRYTPPAALASTLGSVLDMKGTVVSTTQASGDSDVKLTATSNIKWAGPFAVPGLELGNLALEASASNKANKRSSETMLSADAIFRGIEARARFGMTTDGSGRDGHLIELVARKEGDLLNINKLVGSLNLLPAQYRVSVSSFLDLMAKGVMIASEAGSGRVSVAAEDVVGKINGNSFKGQIAVVGVTSNSPVLFIRSDERLKPAKFLPVPAGPFADMAVPKGLVVMAPAKADSDLSELHPRIYEKVFAELFGAREAARHVLTSEGLTVVGKMNLSRDLPADIAKATSWLPVSGEMVVGAGFDGPRLALYVDIDGLNLKIPPPLDTFVTKAAGNIQAFIKSAGATEAGVVVGLSTNATLRVPRLDTGTLQEVDTTLSIAARTAGAGAPSMTFGAAVAGTWADPLGLEGFSLTDTSVSFGQTTTGVTLAISSDRAQFRDSTGATRAFALDLNTAWLPGPVPTQLAVQFKKSPDTRELVVGPILQAELMNSVLKVALKGGSALAGTIRSRVASAGVPAPQLAAFNSFANAVGDSSAGALSLLRSSPLAMIGLRNPEVFFVTPGDSLPPRPGIEQPPFGIGLLVKGDLIFDVGTAEKLPIASGIYKINLLDGYFVRGTLTPPAPLNTMSFQLAGSQPLIGPAPQVRVSGDFALPGGEVVPGVRPSLSGYFDFSRPAGLPLGADVAGRVRVGGFGLQRDFSMNIRAAELTVYSAPSDCADAPVKLDGSISMNNILSTSALLAIAKPDVSLDPIGCVKSLAALAGMAVDAGIYAGNTALGLVTNNPVETAKSAVRLGKDAVDVASKRAQQLGDLALDAAYLVINPSAAYQKLLSAFNDAVKALENASKALVNLGCKIGISPACDERRRERERERYRAEKRAFDAAVALRDEQTRQANQKREVLRAAQTAREDAEVAQRTLRSTIVTNETSFLTNAMALGVAARCKDDEYWDSGLRRCWKSGEMMIAHTGGDKMQCLAPNKDRLAINQPIANSRLADGCAIDSSDYYRWTPLPDGRLRGQASPYRFNQGDQQLPPGFFCLNVSREYDPALDKPPVGRVAVGRALDASSECGFPSGARFNFTGAGELVTQEGGLCVMPKKDGTKNPYLFLRACDDPLYKLPAGKKRWTFIATRDYAAEAKLPSTVKIRPASENSVCLAGSRDYNDSYALENCNASDDINQYFRFAMRNATQFMLIARQSALCLSAGSSDGQVPGLVSEMCLGDPAQTFELVGSPSGPVQFRHPASGKCLALDGSAASGQLLGLQSCVAGGPAQVFSLATFPNAGKTFAAAPLLASALSPQRQVEVLRDSRMSFRTTYRALAIKTGSGAAISQLATGPTTPFVVQGSGGASVTITEQDIFLSAPRMPGADLVSLRRIPRQAKSTSGGYYSDWHQFLKNVNGQLVWTYDWSADSVADSYATFRLVPGLTGTANTVSLQSIVDSTQYIVYRNGGLFMGSATDGAAAVFGMP